MTKGGVRIALKLIIIDSVTMQKSETVMLMHLESISILSYNLINSKPY